ncbi:hypothetical protein BDY21DRAFT_334064 [Lineolata rhizophorae]|uniref:Secreted protein n=1 Tax=Lineolata rhizophorae TaxID=578093 RepID=A0A6A6PAZ3_9PEZI|nr:hypothetical protein BDY21DRAFT_334064 [Lineolata rhizophorae]
MLLLFLFLFVFFFLFSTFVPSWRGCGGLAVCPPRAPAGPGFALRVGLGARVNTEVLRTWKGVGRVVWGKGQFPMREASRTYGGWYVCRYRA